MFKYAQIDISTGRCISVSFLSGEVDADHMILLGDEDNVNPNDIYTDGDWTNVPPIEVPVGGSIPEKIAAVEAQTADLNLQIIDLFEQLLNKGVL